MPTREENLVSAAQWTVATLVSTGIAIALFYGIHAAFGVAL